MGAAKTNFDIADTFQVVEQQNPCQHIREYPRATATSQEEVLYLAVKQYASRDNLHLSPGAVSIMSAYGNGVPKVTMFPSCLSTALTVLQEAYEPLWVDIYQAPASPYCQFVGFGWPTWSIRA